MTYLLSLEEEEKQEQQLEQIKSTLLVAFPSEENLKKLYDEAKEEDEGFIELTPETFGEVEDLQDILEQLALTQTGNSE